MTYLMELICRTNKCPGKKWSKKRHTLWRHVTIYAYAKTAAWGWLYLTRPTERARALGTYGDRKMSWRRRSSTGSGLARSVDVTVVKCIWRNGNPKMFIASRYIRVSHASFPPVLSRTPNEFRDCLCRSGWCGTMPLHFVVGWCLCNYVRRTMPRVGRCLCIFS